MSPSDRSTRPPTIVVTLAESDSELADDFDFGSIHSVSNRPWSKELPAEADFKQVVQRMVEGEYAAGVAILHGEFDTKIDVRTAAAFIAESGVAKRIIPS